MSTENQTIRNLSTVPTSEELREKQRIEASVRELIHQHPGQFAVRFTGEDESYQSIIATTNLVTHSGLKRSLTASVSRTSDGIESTIILERKSRPALDEYEYYQLKIISGNETRGNLQCLTDAISDNPQKNGFSPEAREAAERAIMGFHEITDPDNPRFFRDEYCEITPPETLDILRDVKRCELSVTAEPKLTLEDLFKNVGRSGRNPIFGLLNSPR
ncbi:hypothetical protein ISS86_01250 [Candidatus Microgenomates bacterium]|nr:hypothetical protein [Candidatus Microgenomates bacterium]